MPDRDAVTLSVGPDGVVRCAYDERFDPAALGPATIARAGHVEPDRGGRWWADLGPVGGPRLGPFARRGEAVAAERGWLDVHWPGPRFQDRDLAEAGHGRDARRRAVGRWFLSLTNQGVRMNGFAMGLVLLVLALMFVGCWDQSAAVARPPGAAPAATRFGAKVDS